MARSIVVKGRGGRPSGLLDETALFLHRIVTDLPAEKQRMLERLTSSDEDLVGKDRAPGRRRRPQTSSRLSSVLERRGMRGAHRDHRPGRRLS